MSALFGLLLLLQCFKNDVLAGSCSVSKLTPDDGVAPRKVHKLNSHPMTEWHLAECLI